MDELSYLTLAKSGREYFTITFTGLPADATTVHARVAGGEWNPVEHTGDGWRILLRGPNTTTDTGYLVGKTGVLEVRVTDTPEVIIRTAGYIRLS